MTPNPQALDHLGRELRDAVLASDHARAMRLTMEYGEAVREHWTQLSRKERAASQLPKLSLQLLAWVREMTLMQQALAAQHLAMIDQEARALTARASYLKTAGLEAAR